MFNVIQKKITVDFFWHKSRNFPNCVAKQPANLIFSWTSFPCMFLNISKFICMRLYVRDIWYRNIKIVITWSWYRDICEWLKAWMSVSQSDSGWYLWIAEFKVSAKREINIFTIISPRHISSRILWHFATRPPPFPWYILLYIYILLYYNQSCREASAAVPLMPRWIFATGPSLGCSRFFGRRPDFFFKRTSFFSFERHRASPKVAPTHSCSLLCTVLANVPTINCSDQGHRGKKMRKV